MRRNPAQDRKLTPGDIKLLKKHGLYPEEMKEEMRGLDLFKDEDGNVYIKPKDGAGLGEPTEINLKGLK